MCGTNDIIAMQFNSKSTPRASSKSYACWKTDNQCRTQQLTLANGETSKDFLSGPLRNVLSAEVARPVSVDVATMTSAQDDVFASTPQVSVATYFIFDFEANYFRQQRQDVIVDDSEESDNIQLETDKVSMKFEGLIESLVASSLQCGVVYQRSSGGSCLVCRASAERKVKGGEGRKWET